VDSTRQFVISIAINAPAAVALERQGNESCTQKVGHEILDRLQSTNFTWHVGFLVSATTLASV